MKQLAWTKCALTTAVSSVPGRGDVLSSSLVSLAAHFLPVGKNAREL